MNKLFDLISHSPAIKAFGISLLHSLWQGVFIALLLWIAMRLLQNFKAQLRYYVALLALLLLSTSFCITFYLQYDQPATPLTSKGIEVISLEEMDNGEVQLNEFSEISYLQQIETLWNNSVLWLKDQIAYIFIIWSLGFLFYSGRFLIGLSFLDRLKQQKTPIPQNWIRTMEALQQKIGLQKKVRLVASNQISAPITFGWLKPIIIFPASVLAQLPVDQMETILLHELIHIRQKDYLVSLLQSTAEMVFFFNPGFWYISSLLNKERENACDDLVITHSENTITYARALSSLAELCYLKNSTPALAVAKNQQQLLSRIKRIVSPPKPQKAMKTFLKDRSYQLAPIAIFCLLLALFTLDVKGNIQSYNLYREIEKTQLNDTSREKSFEEAQTEVETITIIAKDFFQMTNLDSKGNVLLTSVTADSIILYENNSLRGTGNRGSHGRFHDINLEVIQEETQSKALYNRLSQNLSFHNQSREKPHVNITAENTNITGNDPLILIVKSKAESINLDTETGEEKFKEIIRKGLSEGIVVSDIQDIPAEVIGSVTVIKDEAETLFGEKGKNGVMIVSLKDPSQETQIRAKKGSSPIEENPLILVFDHQNSFILEKAGTSIHDIAKVALERGQPIEDANILDPQSIQSIQVYKKQQAAFFGEKTKGGVILITLKEGFSIPANFITEEEKDFILYPNPSDDMVKIKFSLPSPETVKITVHDKSGNLVTTIENSLLEKGTHEFEWDASQQTPGIYGISLQKGSHTQSERVKIE